MTKRIISIVTVLMLTITTLAVPTTVRAESAADTNTAETFISESLAEGEDNVSLVNEGESGEGGSDEGGGVDPIPQPDISDAVISAGSSFTYSGDEIKPEVTVVYGDTELVEGTDYTVTYSGDLINAGTDNGIITVTGMGDYTGEKVKTFSIKPLSLSNATVKFKYSNYYYKGGSKIYPTFTVTHQGKTLENGKDFKATYSNNTYPGQVKVTITGINNYTSKIVKTNEIAKVSGFKVKTAGTKTLTLSWSPQKKVTGYVIYKYSSSKKKWVKYATVKGSSNVTCKVTKLSPGTAYKFMVKSYVKKGSKTYYSTGTKLGTPTKPSQVTLSSVKPYVTLKMTVKWKKVKSSGYQVRVSTSSKFKKYTTHKVTSGSTLSTTITGLKDDTTYYVKVRAYRTYDGKTYYGKWSSTKKIKTDGTGWITSGGKQYYYKNGAKLKGLNKVDGNQYYFSKYTGALAGVSETMWDKVKSEPSGSKWLVAVSTTANRVCVYYGSKDNWVLKKYFICTTGKAETPTAKGKFSIPTERDRKLKFGDGYTCWYATRIVGNVYFHSVLYNPESKTSLQDGRLGQNLSHGCIRMALKDAKWIYDNIPVKTKVILY